MNTSNKCDEYTENTVKKQYEEKMKITLSNFIVHCFSEYYEEIINKAPDWYKEEMINNGYLETTGKLCVKGALYLMGEEPEEG